MSFIQFQFIVVLTFLALFVGIECQMFMTPNFMFPFATYTGAGGQGLFHGGSMMMAPMMMKGMEAKYMAKTPGVEHVAPMPGHLKSAVAMNMDPAPGTM